MSFGEQSTSASEHSARLAPSPDGRMLRASSHSPSNSSRAGFVSGVGANGLSARRGPPWTALAFLSQVVGVEGGRESEKRLHEVKITYAGKVRGGVVYVV